MKIIHYGYLEGLLQQMEDLLPDSLPWTNRSIALLLLQGEKEIFKEVREKTAPEELEEILLLLASSSQDEVLSSIYQKRSMKAEELGGKVTIDFRPLKERSYHPLDSLTTDPFTGFPIMILILFLGLYYLVGVLGAGYLVDFFEGFFTRSINPFLVDFFSRYLSYPTLEDLFVGPYGIFTLGFRYAFGIVLPVVGMFFLFFSLLEDSGYLPRIGLLLDRLFKVFGLGGQAVIPVVLGFGCATMATLTTRVLKNERERIITTFLLSLAIPCSAQLGVIFGLLSREPYLLLIWAFVILFVFIFSGCALTLLLPGERSSFLVEIPVLRWPKIGNLFKKTFYRLKWYFFEILPLFILGSFFIWILRLFQVFYQILYPLRLMMGFLGLPERAAEVFFFGFFRRDYGAAGLYDLYQEGIVQGASLLVAAVTLTLFVPCIAQVLVNIKERGLRVALFIVGAIIPFAFLIGYLLHRILSSGFLG